jgi:hypothetical protein
MKTVLEVAQDLAKFHQQEDPQTQGIYLAAPDDEVRLVEVSGSVATAGEVLPFRFAARPDLDLPYPFTVVLLSVDEWEDVRTGKLKLPLGWGDPSSLRKIA